MIVELMTNLRGGELDNAAKAARVEFQRQNLPSSRYLADRLREPPRELVPDDERFKGLFRRFEYLMYLAVADAYQKAGGGFGTVLGLHLENRELPAIIQQEIDKHKERWPLLQAGLFVARWLGLKK